LNWQLDCRFSSATSNRIVSYRILNVRLRMLPESPLMSLAFRSRAFMITIVIVSDAGW